MQSLRIENKRRVALVAVIVILVACLSAAILFIARAGAEIRQMLNPQFRHVQASELKWFARPMPFSKAWNDSQRQFRTSLPLPTSTAPTSFVDATGTYLFIGEEDMVLMVLIPANGAVRSGTAPPMRLAISSLISQIDESGAALPQTQGIPAIVCDLNATQAQYVWNNDVPPSLVEAMKAAARNANWRPFPPNGGMIPATPKSVTVAPAPYFQP